MVDLVKLRKKAKKAPAPEPEPEALPVEGQAPRLSIEPAGEAPVAPRETLEAPATPAESKLDRFKEEAGHRREGLVVETQETTAADIAELLTFVIAGENYAVAIENIVEIVTPRPVTRIPNADDTIVGIISLRGTIVTLLDVRRKLRHLAATAAGADTRIVVLEHRGETVGFEVDRVLRVVKTAAGAIEPHPVVHSSELDDAIRGVFRQANALTILLDLDKLLDSRGHAATQEAIAARR
jgi:purine-binding chemotaxis protein CheW